MKTILRRLDPLRLFALALLFLPALAIFIFGILWLWQLSNLLYWIAAMLTSGCLGYGLQQWLVRRDRKLLADAATEANPDWPPSADKAWQQVEELADASNPDDWPIDDEKWVLDLGKRTLEIVSHHYHPDVEEPLLELTVPHTLLIIEQASHDLRKDISENIPFSDSLTIGDLFRMRRWKDKADQVFDVYRVGRMVINPIDGLTSEVWRHFRESSLGVAKTELHLWLLKAYIHKVGYYAIDLYSGRQPLNPEDPITSRTTASAADINAAEGSTTSIEEEPLRIFVLGRANSGKSSLINALFEKLTTDTNLLPDTTQAVTPYVLQHQGLTQALIFDSPGCDSEYFNQMLIEQVAKTADLILWTSPTNRPDRQSERDCLDNLRTHQASHSERRAAPILIVASYIDQLRPMRSWQPPYDLVGSQEPKAVNIRTAIQAIATDLTIPISQVIPVCLKNGYVYNVDDTLWAAIMNRQDQALSARLQRCMNEKKQQTDWKTLRKQMLGAGRFIRQLIK